MEEKRRLDYAHFGVREHTPFVAWRYEGEIGERRRECATMQEAQDAYNELARHAQKYGIMPTHEPVSAHIFESIVAKDARIAALEAQLREREARAESAESALAAAREENERKAQYSAQYLAETDGMVAGLQMRIAELESELAALRRADDTGEMPEAFVDFVRSSMQSVWDEFVADCGCHPSEFEMRGGKLWADFSTGGNWSRWVAQLLWRWVPRARADDAGRVERVKTLLMNHFGMHGLDWDSLARAVLAAADGRET